MYLTCYTAKAMLLLNTVVFGAGVLKYVAVFFAAYIVVELGMHAGIVSKAGIAFVLLACAKGQAKAKGSYSYCFHGLHFFKAKATGAISVYIPNIFLITHVHFGRTCGILELYETIITLLLTACEGKAYNKQKQDMGGCFFHNGVVHLLHQSYKKVITW